MQEDEWVFRGCVSLSIADCRIFRIHPRVQAQDDVLIKQRLTIHIETKPINLRSMQKRQSLQRLPLQVPDNPGLFGYWLEAKAFGNFGSDQA